MYLGEVGHKVIELSHYPLLSNRLLKPLVRIPVLDVAIGRINTLNYEALSGMLTGWLMSGRTVEL